MMLSINQLQNYDSHKLDILILKDASSSLLGSLAADTVVIARDLPRWLCLIPIPFYL